jgi:hypothetical protein
MTIIEKLEGRIDKYIKEECIKQDLKRIVSEMLPLRAFENETENYCRDYLYTDGKEPKNYCRRNRRTMAQLKKVFTFSHSGRQKTIGYLYYVIV